MQQDTQDDYRAYKPGEIWMPLFDFGNAVAPHSAYDVTIRAFPDGRVRYFERSSAQLSNDLYLQTFPFDTQMLKIQIQPTISQENIVDFFVATLKEFPEVKNQKAFSAESDAFSGLAQWAVIDLTATVHAVRGLINEPLHTVDFVVDVERRTKFYLLKVFLPLFMMVILSWAVFWIDPRELNSQVQISVTTILTVIAFSFAISSSLPKVPYLTFIDAFFLACYFFVFITAIVITSIHVLRSRNLETTGRRIQRISQIGLPALFLITMLIMAMDYTLLTI